MSTIQKIALSTLLALGIVLVLVVWWARRDPRPSAGDIPRWSPEEIAELSAGGWAETFDRPIERTMTIAEYDRRWELLFGRLRVLADRQVAAGTEGGQDGGDDYAFFRHDPPLGNVEITMDGWWGGEWRSLATQGVVQPVSPHRLYEAALWEGAFSLFYFHGPAPSDYETLASVEVGDLDRGFYRIRFRTEHDGDQWLLRAELWSRERDERVATVEAVDDRLPPTGWQGIGVLSGERTLVSGIAVRSLDPGT